MMRASFLPEIYLSIYLLYASIRLVQSSPQWAGVVLEARRAAAEATEARRAAEATARTAPATIAVNPDTGRHSAQLTINV